MSATHLNAAHGYCDPAFAAVSDAFAAQLTDGHGVAVCVVVDGRPVVDLWGGSAGGRPWAPDTVINVYSATKGLLATLAHLLELDLDAPVAHYWPEFATAGKHTVPVAEVLAHRAGLPALRDPLAPAALYDWDTMTSALASATPWWVPGTRHGYHVLTFGWLVGELLRRATGRRVRDLVTGELARPLDADLHLGLPAGLAARAARVTHGPVTDVASNPSPLSLAMADKDSMVSLAFLNPADPAGPEVVNLPRWRKAEIPAANGHANARGLALLYSALVTGRLVPPDRLQHATTTKSVGADEILLGPTRFGLGYMLPNQTRPFAPTPGTFGHPGAGGALGFGDLTARIGFGFTPSLTLPTFSGPDPRWEPLVSAVYECV